MADIEKWKKIIISLPEQIFFDLMRNYLGDVKTPFNKHSLIQELASFFRKEKNIEKIISLIDKNDASILAALNILGPVRIKMLYQFFEDKKNYYDFCLHLQNLEERMLICTDEDCGEFPLLIISPLFEDILSEKILSPAIVVPASETSVLNSTENSFWLNDSLLFSIFSFLLRKGQVLKLDGNFRKKVTVELNTIFPDQLSYDPEMKIDIIRTIFRRIGLVKQEGDYFRPVLERWKELAELSSAERKLLCVGAAFSRDYKLYSPLIDAFMKTLCSSGRGFSEKTLLKIFDLICIKNSLPLPEERENFFNTLLGFGFIEKDGEYYFPDPGYFSTEDTIPSTMEKFVIQPNFDIHVSKNIDFKDGILLAITAEINRYSEVVYFSFSRDSFLRALEAGYDSKSITELFNRLGGFAVPQNIAFSMESWEKEYKSLTFYSGVVMLADEKKRNIIDNSGHFSSNLCKKLSEGVYLINQKNISVLFETFRKAGIENIPSPGSLVPGYIESDEQKTHVTYLHEDVNSFAFIAGIELDYEKPCPSLPESVFPELPEIKEKIDNSHFNAEQKEVLSGRVERKLILFPEQISKGNARYEKTEARGLDYNGKVRIAEQVAGNTGYLVEINENNSDGESVKRLIKATKLEKDGNSYYLKGLLLQDDSEVTISISKVSLIRKIRTSLFVK